MPFLESPVLLPNSRAFSNSRFLVQPLFMHGSGEVSLGKSCTSSCKVDERTSNGFEFKFHTGSKSSLMNPAGLEQHGLFGQVQDQLILQVPAPSVLASSDQKDGISITSSDRTSDEGYNWTKYEQKPVKGSELPQSYYKCTCPSCEVKRMFECCSSGHITEIVYKGSHNHPKPASSRHNPGALTSIQEEKFDNESSFTGQDALSPHQETEDAQILNNNNADIDPFSTPRKMEDGFDFAQAVKLKTIREPRVVVQTVSEVDILDDGHTWRKYGQKVVRGNPNPRSYYKWTSPECPVRKHMERAAHDPKAVITTYEGKHDHDVPTAKSSNHAFSGLRHLMLGIQGIEWLN